MPAALRATTRQNGCMLVSSRRLASVGVLFALACGGESADVHAITPEMCMQAGAQLASAECPSGTSPLPVELDDDRRCCADGPITRQACLAIGGIVRTDPGNGSLKGCSDGEFILAGLGDTIEGGYCCAP
jgi:hypothetical protein